MCARATAESITSVIDDSPLRGSPCGPASPLRLRQSRAAALCRGNADVFSVAFGLAPRSDHLCDRFAGRVWSRRNTLGRASVILFSCAARST
jgi:hypothetical protein